MSKSSFCHPRFCIYFKVFLTTLKICLKWKLNLINGTLQMNNLASG